MKKSPPPASARMNSKETCGKNSSTESDAVGVHSVISDATGPACPRSTWRRHLDMSVASTLGRRDIRTRFPWPVEDRNRTHCLSHHSAARLDGSSRRPSDTGGDCCKQDGALPNFNGRYRMCACSAHQASRHWLVMDTAVPSCREYHMNVRGCCISVRMP